MTLTKHFSFSQVFQSGRQQGSNFHWRRRTFSSKLPKFTSIYLLRRRNNATGGLTVPLLRAVLLHLHQQQSKIFVVLCVITSTLNNVINAQSNDRQITVSFEKFKPRFIILQLQAYCKHNLERNVTVDNVIQILEAAECSQVRLFLNLQINV
jgi:hypothetical protein